MTTTAETATITGKRARFGAIPDRYKAFIQQGMVVLVLIMLVVFFSVMNSNFANWGNISSLLLASVVTGIQALGLSFVIATGGIDLTPGFGMAATSVFAALLIAQTGGLGLPIWIGILGALFAGALLGAINGFLVSYVRMQPMIATLAMMMVAWGTALVLADGKTISLRSVKGYDQIAIGELIPGIPNAVLILIGLAIVAGILMNKTAVGRYSLAIGSNEEATRISGVNTRRWKMLAYIIGGTFTGISGILMSSRLSAAQPTLGQGYEMYAIAAAVIGGTSLRGGRASIFGAVIGAVTIQTIFNGLTVMGVQDQWQKVVLGAVVLLAVFVDIVRRGGKEE
ncbi:MAG: ABC transporter permease [Arachnia sp.]